MHDFPRMFILIDQWLGAWSVHCPLGLYALPLIRMCIAPYAYVQFTYCVCASPFSWIKTLFLNLTVAKLNMHLPLPLTHYFVRGI